jgi:hypothetical protein
VEFGADCLSVGQRLNLRIIYFKEIRSVRIASSDPRRIILFIKERRKKKWGKRERKWREESSEARSHGPSFLSLTGLVFLGE